MKVRVSDLRHMIEEEVRGHDLESVVANQPDSLQRIADIIASGVKSGDADVNVSHNSITIYPEGVMGSSLILKANGTWRYVR